MLLAFAALSQGHDCSVSEAKPLGSLSVPIPCSKRGMQHHLKWSPEVSEAALSMFCACIISGLWFRLRDMSVHGNLHLNTHTLGFSSESAAPAPTAQSH